MGVRDEVLNMLGEGLSPGKIASQRHVTLQTINGYIAQLIGQGRLRRSDVLFSIPAEIRHAIIAELSDVHSTTVSAVVASLQGSGLEVTPDDVIVVLEYGGVDYALGEIYEDIRTIEIGLHDLIRQTLEKEFSPDESGWWRRGVPKEIRKKCQERREDDDFDPAPEAYHYTDLIDLREILKQQWPILNKRLPKETANDKKTLMDDLIRLNQIRRIVMHPVRGGRPSEDDFEFLRSLKKRLGFV
jgi:hypothetical protein